MSLNHVYNLPFFDTGMYEKLAYDQLCRQLLRCNEPSMVLAIIQDLLEYSNNTIFNDFLIYDRLGCCLRASTDSIKKKGLLVLYRCLIFISEGNTYEMVKNIFNDIIACGYSHGFEIKRISMQCLKIIISDLTVEQFIICIKNTILEFLTKDSGMWRHKLSEFVKEIFNKLPVHFEGRYIIDKLTSQVKEKSDIAYQFVLHHLSMDYIHNSNGHCVLKGDIFPRYCTEKVESESSQFHRDKRNNVDDSLQLINSINQSNFNSSNLVNNNIQESIPDYSKQKETFPMNSGHYPGSIHELSPQHFLRSEISDNAQRQSRYFKPQWWNDIYKGGTEKFDLPTESVPTYFLDAVRKSATKRKNALLKTYNYVSDNSSTYSTSNTNSRVLNTLKNNQDSGKINTLEIIDDEMVKKYPIKLPQLKSSNGIVRTASFPSIKRDFSQGIKRMQTAVTVLQNKSHDYRTIDAIMIKMKSSDWEKICEGLEEMQNLLKSDKFVLIDNSTIKSIIASISDAIKSPRSQVSRLGMETLNKMIELNGSRLDQESDQLAEIITKKTSEINRFIREDADKAMKNMLLYLSTDRSIDSLSRIASNNRNANIRRTFSVNVHWLCKCHLDKICNNSRLILKITGLAEQMSSDANDETRQHGRSISLMMLQFKDDFS